jgi:hypothetical protein
VPVERAVPVAILRPGLCCWRAQRLSEATVLCSLRGGGPGNALPASVGKACTGTASPCGSELERAALEGREYVLAASAS